MLPTESQKVLRPEQWQWSHSDRDVAIYLMPGFLENAYEKVLPHLRCQIEAASADVSPRVFNLCHNLMCFSSSLLEGNVSPLDYRWTSRPSSSNGHETARCSLGSCTVVLLSKTKDTEREKSGLRYRYIFFFFRRESLFSSSASSPDVELSKSRSSPLNPQLRAGCSWTEARPVSFSGPKTKAYINIQNPHRVCVSLLFWYLLRVLGPCYL